MDNWDIGYSSATENILGAMLNTVDIIAVAGSEAASYSMVYGMDAANRSQTVVAITPASPLEYVLQHCFTVNIIESCGWTRIDTDQQTVLELLTNGTANYGSLWGDYLYDFYDTGIGGWDCDGNDETFQLPLGVMVRKTFLEESADNHFVVARVLAAWFRAISYIIQSRKQVDSVENNDGEIIDYLDEYLNTYYNMSYSQQRVKLQESQMILFSLPTQLEHMNRDNGVGSWDASEWDLHYQQFTDYLTTAGALPTNGTPPAPEDYITDKYLRMIQDNTTLFQFALLGEQPVPVVDAARTGGGGTGLLAVVFALGFLLLQ